MTPHTSPRTESSVPVFLMNDHDEAYHHWKKMGVRGKTLVHFDAHIDFEWIAAKKPEELLDAASFHSFSEALRNAYGWKMSTPDHQKVHLGNYLHEALKEGMVNRWYWVVPDPMWNSPFVRRRIWKDLLDFYRYRTGAMEFPRRGKKGFEASFLGVPAFVGPLSSLPLFEEPVLVNIDVDYLTSQVFKKIPTPAALRTQQPWIWPEVFYRALKEKGIVPEAAAIARSVNGGYTPIAYKFLGEVLKNLFLGRAVPEAYEKIKSLLTVGQMDAPRTKLSYLNSFRSSGELETARLYQKALAECDVHEPGNAKKTFELCTDLDPEFLSPYNSNARFYESCGKFKEALEEYALMKVLLPYSLENLAGEAKCLTALNRIVQAKGKCLQVLEWNSEHADVLFLMGKLLLAEKKYPQAEGYLKRCLALKPDSVMVKMLLGEVLYRQKSYAEAKMSLREALGGGGHFPVTYFLLAKTYAKLGYFKKSCGFLMEWFRLMMRKSLGF